MGHSNPDEILSQEEVMELLSITEEALNDVEVEIE